MPSTSRFGFAREAVRNHPVITASWAATAGLLLGTFVTLKVMMPEPRAEKIGPTQAVAEKTQPAKPAAETTGSAPTSDAVASATEGCDRQAWPYQSKDCLEAERGKTRPLRVVTTTPPAMANEATPPPSGQPQTMPTSTAAVSTPTPSASVSVTGTFGSDATASGVADAEHKAAQPGDQQQATREKPKRVATKLKAKPAPKVLPQVAPGDRADSEDDGRVATAAQEDNPSDERVGRVRTEPRHRVVDRRTERNYDVPSDDDSSGRRIIVIRRGVGPFEGLFGSFGN